MGVVDAYPSGAFCWVDLGTTDVSGATSFYRELFGWDVEEVPAGPGETYTTCRLDGKLITGIHRHSEDEGIGWSSSIRVDDADRAATRAAELGATVEAEASDVPGVARVAAIRDPAGAQVALWEPRGQPGAGVVNEIGTWTWNELVAPDLDPALAFYGGLFGWVAAEVPAPMRRVSLAMGGLLVGGAHAPAPGEHAAPRWDVSFRVDDVDAFAELAGRLGGRVLVPAMDIPIGRFAVLADPAGAGFTVTSFAGPFRGVDGS